MPTTTSAPVADVDMAVRLCRLATGGNDDPELILKIRSELKRTMEHRLAPVVETLNKEKEEGKQSGFYLWVSRLQAHEDGLNQLRALWQYPHNVP